MEQSHDAPASFGISSSLEDDFEIQPGQWRATGPAQLSFNATGRDGQTIAVGFIAPGFDEAGPDGYGRWRAYDEQRNLVSDVGNPWDAMLAVEMPARAADLPIDEELIAEAAHEASCAAFRAAGVPEDAFGHAGHEIIGTALGAGGVAAAWMASAGWDMHEVGVGPDSTDLDACSSASFTEELCGLYDRAKAGAAPDVIEELSNRMRAGGDEGRAERLLEALSIALPDSGASGALVKVREREPEQTPAELVGDLKKFVNARLSGSDGPACPFGSFEECALVVRRLAAKGCEENRRAVRDLDKLQAQWARATGSRGASGDCLSLAAARGDAR